eukprot:6890493-Pyramimonas_sp.AAC.3
MNSRIIGAVVTTSRSTARYHFPLYSLEPTISPVQLFSSCVREPRVWSSIYDLGDLLKSSNTGLSRCNGLRMASRPLKTLIPPQCGHLFISDHLVTETKREM